MYYSGKKIFLKKRLYLLVTETVYKSTWVLILCILINNIQTIRENLQEFIFAMLDYIIRVYIRASECTPAQRYHQDCFLWIWRSRIAYLFRRYLFYEYNGQSQVFKIAVLPPPEGFLSSPCDWEKRKEASKGHLHILKAFVQ